VLFGRDPRTPFEVALVSEAAAGDALDVQAARARALLRRPELQHARLQVELADTDRRSKKTEFIPQISVALSYDSFVNVDLLPRNIAQVGIQMRWEPFDWGRKQKELASKALAVEQARTQSRDQANRVLAEVERAHRQLQEARSLLAVRRLAHEGAQERSRVTLLRAGQQAVLVKDVLSAQASLSDARAQLDEAQLSLWQARADLDKAMGEEN
jgi:outer membrane protein TolC